MFKITEINGKPNSYSKKSFLLTSPDDLDKLPKVGVKGTQNSPDDSVVDEPCAVGSEALLVYNGLTEVYILTPDNEWVKM